MSKNSSKYSEWSKDQLIAKIQELETQAAGKKSLEVPVISEQKKQKRNKPARAFDFSKFSTRFIALKFSYLGWNYNGLAIQKEPTPLPTVEGVIIEALNKCKLVPSLNPGDFKFSRCGRTDRGVSALNQVISLRVRSNLDSEEQKDPTNDEKEIDYLNILNSILPSDIKIHAVSLRPPTDFDARFSCTSRHYKYLFHKKDLDIGLMQEAAQHYEGEYDFRNFCKLDGSKQIKNYNRTIIRSQIEQIDDEFFVFDLEGSAFLWHQVRNMIGVLFLIGQRLEKPEIIKELLDVSLYPTRPLFDMGSDLPLVLYDCKFPPMEWINAKPCVKNERTLTTLYANHVETKIKNQIAKYMMGIFPSLGSDINEHRVRINLGDGRGKIVGEYVPLAKRERMENFEIVNERWLKRQKN